MREKRNMIIVAAVIVVFLIIYTIIVQNKKDVALKNTVLEIATITNMYNTSGPETVEVEFKFAGKLTTGSFATYHWDSLKVNNKIKVLVSKEFPNRYIKYVGVLK